MWSEADHTAGQDDYVDAFTLDCINNAGTIVGSGDVCLDELVESDVRRVAPTDPDHVCTAGREPLRERLAEPTRRAHEEHSGLGQGGHPSSVDDCPLEYASEQGEIRPVSASRGLDV